ncbi:MAG: hypothetical protein ACYTG6_00105 [Planctomycetota bacterium]|jgi:hypothetical protein
MLDFDAFAARARALAAALPAEFMEGIESVEVHRERQGHPYLEDVVTLGECATSPIWEQTGVEPFRSVVHLYYGSFVDLARKDPSFDIEHELEETLEHEVQHHLEDRAGIKTLRDEDDLFEAHARFRGGLDVPAGWYRRGEHLGPDLWAVDLDLFLELHVPRSAWKDIPGSRLRLVVLERPLEIDVPEDAEPDEIWTFEGEGFSDREDEDESDADEADADEAGDDEAGDDDASAPVGALHIIPMVV